MYELIRGRKYRLNSMEDIIGNVMFLGRYKVNRINTEFKYRIEVAY